MEYGADFKVRVWLEADDPELAKENASLIVHELATNAGKMNGLVEIDYTRKKYLVYRDETQVVY